MLTLAPSGMDRINQRTWRKRSCVAKYRSAEGFSDLGERAALDSIALETKGQPILDLGVGGGRTVPLLCEISSDYVALDYTPELVEACRERFPGVRVSEGDARDLSRFADESFKLVVFSYNGIDSVDRLDRFAILREVHRVLRPDGIFVFSAHNLTGRHFEKATSLETAPSSNPIRVAARAGKWLFHQGRSLFNQSRYAKLEHQTNDYAIVNDSAEDHGIVIHYASLAAQLRELVEEGFRPDPVVYDNLEGHIMSTGDDASSVWWFHFVVRK